MVISTHKKAQIKLFESIAVLIVFVFLISIGMRFYSGVQMQAFEDTQREFFQLNSIKASTLISNLPELTCSFSGTSSTACFDAQKVRSWDSIVSSTGNLAFQEYYLPLFGNSEVVIEIIYPHPDEYVIFNSSLDGGFDFVRVPITVYDPVTKQNSLGVLNVKSYYE